MQNRTNPRVCPSRHFAPQPIASLFDHLVGDSPAHRMEDGADRVKKSYDSRLATSAMYFSYSAREISPHSRSPRARSPADKDACTSSTRFQGASGVSHVERGTYSDGLTLL